MSGTWSENSLVVILRRIPNSHFTRTPKCLKSEFGLEMEKKLKIESESNVEMDMEGSANSGFIGAGPEVNVVLLIKEENIRDGVGGPR